MMVLLVICYTTTVYVGFCWAFQINMMIVVVVLRAMFREKSIDKKTSFEKAR